MTKIVLLHAHGTAGPKGKRSYLRFGTFRSRKEAIKRAKSMNLDGRRIVPQSKIGKTAHKELFYVKS